MQGFPDAGRNVRKGNARRIRPHFLQTVELTCVLSENMHHRVHEIYEHPVEGFLPLNVPRVTAKWHQSLSHRIKDGAGMDIDVRGAQHEKIRDVGKPPQIHDYNIRRLLASDRLHKNPDRFGNGGGIACRFPS